MIFEGECMPGSNSCSAAFFRSYSMGSASISCIFDICKGLELVRNRQSRSRLFQQFDDWLRCYRDTRLRDDMPRELNPLNT